MAAQPQIPIVLGVTGHREIPPHVRERVRARVEEILRSFCNRFEGTQVILLSSLAEGADQLCAEVALQLNLCVIAPLPFPATVYRDSTSFATEESRQKLNALLQHQMVESFVVALPEDMMPRADADWEKLSNDDAKRRTCYANAGAYVALHSHALIALWDGVTTERPAGTAQIVRFKLTGEPPEHYPWQQPLFKWADSGPVYVIYTPRADGANSDGGQPPARVFGGMPQAGDYRELYPGVQSVTDMLLPSGKASHLERAQQAAEKRQFEQTCGTIQQFNREVAALDHMTRDTTTRPASSDPGEANPLALTGVALIQQRLKDLSRVRAAAGQLAQKYHARVGQLTVVLFGLIFVTLLCLHLYAHNTDNKHEHNPLFLSLFLLLLLCL